MDGSQSQERRRRMKQSRKVPSLLNAPSKRKRKVPQEEEFLHAVEAGDLPTVRRMLRSCPGLDMNCTDLLGQTPLRIAVQNENEEIVELLLDRADIKNMHESLLLAISLDHDFIALSILRHPMYDKLQRNTKEGLNDSQFVIGESEDSLFSSETTPVILSAQRNRYEVLSFLLKQGAKIEEPHDYSCDCAVCKDMRESDELRYAKSRINAYKGMASEAYICLESRDPIRTAFNLRRRLGRVAVNEKHYRDEYSELRGRLSSYVVKLLDKVRGNEELDVILNSDENGEEKVLACLQLALKYNEKKFVAHSSCQKKLSTIWYGKFQENLSRFPTWGHPLFILVIGVAFPFLALFYMLAPSSRVRDILQTPYIKFIGQTSSYFCFLFFICISSFQESPSHLTTNSTLYASVPELQPFLSLTQNLTKLGYPASMHLRIFMPNSVQVAFLIFIVGMVWQEMKQLYRSNLKEYFSSLFNIMDSASLSLYIASFTLRFLSFYKTRRSLSFFGSNPVASLESLWMQEPDALYRYYWLFADRMYWDMYDPIIMAEGLFAIANIISFARLFYLLAANEQLGPLQISLRRMISDILRFSFILVIIFTGFMIGLNNLYWYYEPTVRAKVEITSFHDSPVTEAGEAFGTFEKTFTSMFWVMFGMGDHTAVTLSGYDSGYVTERIGYQIFGIYNIIIVIIILNMLIAMMARSFEAIVQEEDTEWKFARTKLYMDFIEPGGTLPVPFNLIPSLKTILRAVQAVRACCPPRKHSTDTHQKLHAEFNTTDVMDGPGDSNPQLAAPSGDGPTNSLPPAVLVDNLRTRNPKLLNVVFDLRSEDKSFDTSSVTSKGRLTPKGSLTSALGDSAIERLKDLGRNIINTHEKKVTTDKPSYDVVIKRVVKRYIFESQQTESTQIEGDVDELKQDFAGLRYELNNTLHNNQKVVLKTMNQISTALEGLRAAYQASTPPPPPAPAPGPPPPPGQRQASPFSGQHGPEAGPPPHPPATDPARGSRPAPHDAAQGSSRSRMRMFMRRGVNPDPNPRQGTIHPVNDKNHNSVPGDSSQLRGQGGDGRPDPDSSQHNKTRLRTGRKTIFTTALQQDGGERPSHHQTAGHQYQKTRPVRSDQQKGPDQHADQYFDPHHDPRLDSHHDPHLDKYHDPHRDPHRDPHHDPHRDPHIDPHHDPHHDPHLDNHHDPHHDPHRDPQWEPNLGTRPGYQSYEGEDLPVSAPLNNTHPPHHPQTLWGVQAGRGREHCLNNNKEALIEDRDYRYNLKMRGKLTRDKPAYIHDSYTDDEEEGEEEGEGEEGEGEWDSSRQSENSSDEDETDTDGEEEEEEEEEDEDEDDVEDGDIDDAYDDDKDNDDEEDYIDHNVYVYEEDEHSTRLGVH